VKTALGHADRKLLREASQIIGVDEVGRGSLAGPVVVSAVAWTRIPRNPEIQDSKGMTALARQRTSGWVRQHCHGWVIVEVWPEAIDRVGIAVATRLAMESAVEELAKPGGVAIVDAVEFRAPDGLRVLSEVRADGRYFSVASASIVAKVHRDGLMTRLATSYPQWMWCKNKGYGTREHRLALSVSGSSFLHRRSFSWRPVLP